MNSQAERINLDWRSKVLELNSQGYSQPEISRILKVSLGTVNRDLSIIRQKAKDNLQKHVQETVPEEYQKCITGMKRNLKQTLEIAESVADPKTKFTGSSHS